MGLFSQRPEEPAEWAGLPSEPARPESAAERLADTPVIDVTGFGLDALGNGNGDVGVVGAGVVESIVIPVAPVIEMTETQGAGEDA